MKQPDYYNLIPQEHHSDLDKLLHYLDTYPFGNPTHCPHCGSDHFNSNCINPLSEIVNYRCMACRRGFNQLTGTYFARSEYIHMHKWGDFARLRLAGKSLPYICNALTLSIQGASIRDRRVTAMMKAHFPQLHRWWQSHQDREQLTLTPQIKQQADTFIHWLSNLLNQPSAPCPHCGNPAKKAKAVPHRALFICFRCEKSFSLLRNTAFHLLHQPEQWVDYTKLLIQGYHDNEISAQLSINRATNHLWRHRFISQIKQQGLEELAQWITWQYIRRKNQKYQITRAKNKKLTSKNKTK